MLVFPFICPSAVDKDGCTNLHFRFQNVHLCFTCHVWPISLLKTLKHNSIKPILTEVSVNDTQQINVLNQATVSSHAGAVNLDKEQPYT